MSESVGQTGTPTLLSPLSLLINDVRTHCTLPHWLATLSQPMASVQTHTHTHTHTHMRTHVEFLCCGHGNSASMES